MTQAEASRNKAAPAAAPTAIKRRDLPLSCPLPDAPVWNQHPKVYLPIENNGHAKCPYCGAEFVLED
ncbi:MAG: zinc-finger domain-containing protein [Gammaproteobacteria bacterium]|nr:zinc-finger domain-containing protein [Gammaproteobacteria bacterium]